VSRGRANLILTAKWALCLLVLVMVGRHVWIHWQAVGQVEPPSPTSLLVGSASALIALLLSSWSCRRLVNAHGYRLSCQRAIGLCFVPMLGKYIPGKVWSILAAMHFYGREGVPKRVATTCLTLYMALGLASAALVTLTFGLASSQSPILLWPCVAATALLLTGLYPPIFYGLINAALKALGRDELEVTISLPELLQVFTILLVGKLAYGSGFFLLMQGFHEVPWHHLPAVIALFTFAQIAGLVAFFAPAGIGVREGVLLVGLQPILGPGHAIVITAVCRLWQTALELLMAGIGWCALRRGKCGCNGDTTGLEGDPLLSRTN